MMVWRINVGSGDDTLAIFVFAAVVVPVPAAPAGAVVALDPTMNVANGDLTSPITLYLRLSRSCLDRIVCRRVLHAHRFLVGRTAVVSTPRYRAAILAWR